jgi:hypothetical protein
MRENCGKILKVLTVCARIVLDNEIATHGNACRYLLQISGVPAWLRNLDRLETYALSGYGASTV